MFGPQWTKLCGIVVFFALGLPGLAAAQSSCGCPVEPVYFLEDTVQGTSCSALGSQLIYNLQTGADQDCVSRGYHRSCGTETNLHSCTLSEGQVYRYGFISYSCAFCPPDLDYPDW